LSSICAIWFISLFFGCEMPFPGLTRIGHFYAHFGCVMPLPVVLQAMRAAGIPDPVAH